jgi:hypothetical protein
LYGRFIGLASADTVIAERPQRFLREPGGIISLRETADAPDASTPQKEPPMRVAFWQRR